MVPHPNRLRSACALAAAALVLATAAPIPLAAAPLAAGQRAACTNDAFRLCGTEVPRVDQIMACLKKARPSLSPACRAVVDLKG
ncbi:hypothetical protein PQJ75_07155 [Rhodoplanes sp. TEM]|uniref:Cysteine rich repeat protein n=1 Tax=Rhodoplanes tepidamans TaxID=200616 RepID=A0ABT5J584_RHOTP|nr:MULTISPECIES: hypothetical protein [Rhodoplanes]MDC7784474.1 hypothetical protein [Rhodoplanes tepidamans]MDC7983504.1 hypothetical protein [Rhodoplanes sp. TEM]MDQ0356982.1 hypothetical protein [Rhodoplanes tepidamans]